MACAYVAVGILRSRHTSIVRDEVDFADMYYMYMRADRIGITGKLGNIFGRSAK